MPDGVPAAQRLLDPEQINVLFESPDVADGLLDLPRLVGVEHQPGP